MPPSESVDAIVRMDGASPWLVFGKPVEVLEARTPGDVAGVIDRAEAMARTRRAYAVGFVAYEAAAAFGLATRTAPPGLPLARFGVYDATGARRLQSPPPGEAWSMGLLEPSLERPAFAAAIDSIRSAIARGDTYQVNFTFRLRAGFSGDPLGLFGDLAEAQLGAYAAFVRAGRYTICSASPELFFERADGRIVARPMKGTAPRGRTLDDDRAAREALGGSAKDRAENVMIVDMMRNDFGRVAEVGSVDVPALFTLERYPNVWQMTSTVTARSDAPLAELFAATFPPASVTGAPKVRTMEIIARLETAPRGVYTGAVGIVEPGGRSRFNVAIRTAVVDHEAGAVEFGIGSGVVWDSKADREYDECLVKGSVLGPRHRRFDLLETLRWTPEEGFFLLERHLARLQASAEYFSVPCPVARVRESLAGAVAAHAGAQRVRLLVGRRGDVRVETAPLDAWPEPVRLAIAEHPIDPADVFLFHKTTNRSLYERLRRPGADDTVLWNPTGEVTETTMANLVVELDGRLVTPPVSAGLLPGTYRAELLSGGEIVEAVVPLDRLRRAPRVWVINAVRGRLRAAVVDIATGKR